MSKMRIDTALLQRLAETAADKVRNDLGIEAECVYLGQVAGPESNRSYVRDPREWILEVGARPTQQTVAFEWRWDESVVVVEQLCKNAQQRGVLRPADLSISKDLWCKAALQQLQRAADAFVDVHGPSILDEFGLQLQCNYKYQAETMEHYPAAWTVQGGGLGARWFPKYRYLE